MTTTTNAITATSAYGKTLSVTVDEKGIVWAGRVLVGDRVDMQEMGWTFA